jgi:hypothetical protein
MLITIEAEFLGPIGKAMPQIIALLKHDDGATQGAGANALSKLSEQCEISTIHQ